MSRLSSNRASESLLRFSFAPRLLVLCGVIMLAGGSAWPAAPDLMLDASRLKPGVLYIDLANPADARGIALADEKQAANLVTKQVGGMAAAEPKDGFVIVKLDPTAVKEETPLLVAFNYYDSDQWDEPIIQGFLSASDPTGVYTALSTSAGAYAESWRWWTTFTYANYKSGYLPNAHQSSFRLQIKDVRWILVLPLDEAALKEMNGIREKTLGMLADYSRLLVAEASLQETRNRLEQGMKYQASGGETPKAVTEVFAEVKAEPGQARVEMDKVIMEVLSVNGESYLGMFDGKMAERQAAVDAFQQKVRGLAERYGALTAKAERCISGQVDAQCAQYGLTKAAFQAPGRMALDHVIKPEDLRSRFFMGLLGETAALALPQTGIDSLTKEQGIDSGCSYCLASYVTAQEDGSYDFSKLDKFLGKPRGLLVEVGMIEVSFPAWAQKKFCGENPEMAPTGYMNGPNVIRVKAADGRWDGYCMPSANRPCLSPLDGVWSDTVFNYSCDFYRAIGKHCRDNPMILRYVLNSEGSADQERPAGYRWDAALPYYREHLKKKFGDIGKLNQAFGSAYKDFAEIPLPKPAEREKMARLTPAYYEYTQLCIDRTKFVREGFARALHETDPNHAVGEVQSSMFGSNAIDTYAMSVNTPYDTFAAGDSDRRSVRYQYSMNRFHPKPIWMYEPYCYTPWRAPEGKGYRIEEATRRILMTNMWTWFFWGHQGIPFFNQRAPEGRADVTDFRIADIMMGLTTEGMFPAHPTVRLAAGSLAVVKPTWERLESVLWSAPMVPARIGLLESSTTQRVFWPADGTFADIAQLQAHLSQEGKHFFFIPETAVVDGTEPLDAYRVIVAGYATHLRPEARDALLAWVKKGGILIGSGPTGLYDHYGHSEGSLPETVFGIKGVEYGAGITEDSKTVKCSGAMAGREGISLFTSKDFYWRLPSKNLSEGTQILASLADGTPVVVERNYGAGKVTLTASAIGSLLDLYWPMVMAEINNAQPVPEAASSAPELSLQVRENAAGIRYLSVYSTNVSAPVEATITVAGEFEHPRDITVGNGWVIPATAAGGVTRFKIWVGPGMGSFIELGKSRTKLSGLSPEEENANLAVGRFTNLMQRAADWGLDTSSDAKKLKVVEKECAAKQYTEVRSRLAKMTQSLCSRWLETRAEKINSLAREEGVPPAAATWAQSYAAIARELMKEGKLESAEDRMDRAEKALSEVPAIYPAETAFPFVSGRLDLKALSKWPKEGWQTVYKDPAAKSGELGQFILVGSPDGIYVGAKVRTDKITDKPQSAGLAWRVMDGVVLNLRCLDVAQDLSTSWQSEDSYEVTFYADGSVFVWENLLSCDANLIRSEVVRMEDGYWVGGFIPGAAIRFWPRPGVNIIADVCLFTYGQKANTDGYWHGTYGQADTWARVRLGEAREGTKSRELTASTAALPADTAQACLRVENWMPQETRGVARASAAFDTDEVLPNGKKGAIVLSSDGQMEEAQLMTRFDEIGRKPGLRVWLKGAGSGARIALRVTGREGSTWQMTLKDDSRKWRAVDVVLDRCLQTTEDLHNEVWNKYQVYRPLLNRLIVRFGKPLSAIEVGLIEYLPD